MSKTAINFAPVGTAPTHRWNGLERVHPALVRKLQTIYQEMESGKDGTRCVMMAVAGYRTQAEQSAIYAQGRTKPGPIVTYLQTSVHQLGLAADSCFVFLDGKGRPQPTWDEPFRGAWDEFGKRTEHRGLTWGGDFTFGDTPHVQLISVAEQKRAFAIWKALETTDEPHSLKIFWAACERAGLFPADV